jgi:hypothetical protein
MLTATLRATFSRILAIALIALGPNLYGQITDHTPTAAKNPELRIEVHADRPAARTSRRRSLEVSLNRSAARPTEACGPS